MRRERDALGLFWQRSSPDRSQAGDRVQRDKRGREVVRWRAARFQVRAGWRCEPRGERDEHWSMMGHLFFNMLLQHTHSRKVSTLFQNDYCPAAMMHGVPYRRLITAEMFILVVKCLSYCGLVLWTLAEIWLKLPTDRIMKEWRSSGQRWEKIHVFLWAEIFLHTQLMPEWCQPSTNTLSHARREWEMTETDIRS